MALANSNDTNPNADVASDDAGQTEQLPYSGTPNTEDTGNALIRNARLDGKGSLQIHHEGFYPQQPARGGVGHNTPTLLDSVMINDNGSLQIHYENHFVGAGHGQTFGPLFGPVAAPAQTPALRARLLIRNKLQQGRTTQRDDENTLYLPYTPYVVVSDSDTKNILLEISDKLHFLDCGFAAYFPSIVDSDPTYARERLEGIRRSIAKVQRSQSHQAADSAQQELDVDVGDLGHFCEQVVHIHAAAKAKDDPGPIFYVTQANVTETMGYLQDALEVPYWDFMLKEFGKWRANTPGLTGDAILRVIYSTKLELKVAVAKLKDQEKTSTCGDNLAPILRGIEARVALLDGIWDDKMDGLRTMEAQLRKCACHAGHNGPATPSTPSADPTMAASTAFETRTPDASSNDTVINMVAVFFFLALAISAFSVGFAKSYKKGGVGSREDADFWFLVQSNIMWTLGSIMMIVPLLRGSWFSLAYLSMWIFLVAGLVCAIVSVTIYTHVHTGWSSMFGLFGSIASAAAVLVVTQGTGKEGGEKEKLKAD